MLSEIARQFNSPLNPLYQEKRALSGQGRKIIDLASGNVQEGGFLFPSPAFEKILERAADRAKYYRPDPLGLETARQAISRYYEKEGLPVPFGQIVLTPGTSISYWYIFIILADPGDEILCPRPSYPLLDHIAELCGVKLVPYRLTPQKRWEIDLEDIASKISAHSKALVLISPHNPTGAVASERELSGLRDIAIKHHLPIINDEVFSPFVFGKGGYPRAGALDAPLVFTLNGFSKMFALPGIKIGWIAVSGEPSGVRNSMQALEMLSDTFLPVNEIAQHAVPETFKEGREFLKRYQLEIAARGRLAADLLSGIPELSFLAPEGGFYITTKLQEGFDEERVALNLLRDQGIFVHPGFLYDLEPGYLVLSYVSNRGVLRSALPRIAEALTGP